MRAESRPAIAWSASSNCSASSTSSTSRPRCTRADASSAATSSAPTAQRSSPASASGERRPQAPHTARPATRRDSASASSSVDFPERAGPLTRRCSPSYTSSSAGARSDSRTPTGSRHGSGPTCAGTPSSATVTDVGSCPTTGGLGAPSPQCAATCATASASDPVGVATWACSFDSASTQRPGTAGGASRAATPAAL